MKKLFYFVLTTLVVFAFKVDAVAHDLFLYAAVQSGAVQPLAKIKWGALAVDGRGKIGGHVLSKNRSGAYMRTKVTPGNPSTTSQGSVRNNFTTGAQAWRGLTAAQRAQWNSAVGNFVGTDIFGDSKTLSGFQLYMRISNNLLFVGEAALTSPPLPSSVPAFTSFSAAVAEGAGTVTLTFAGAIAATEKVICRATPGVSAGKNFVKSEYRMIDIMENLDASPFSIETEYEVKFGSVPPAGTKVFFTLQQINIATGLPGATIQAVAVVAA